MTEDREEESEMEGHPDLAHLERREQAKSLIFGNSLKEDRLKWLDRLISQGPARKREAKFSMV